MYIITQYVLYDKYFVHAGSHQSLVWLNKNDRPQAGQFFQAFIQQCDFLSLVERPEFRIVLQQKFSKPRILVFKIRSFYLPGGWKSRPQVSAHQSTSPLMPPQRYHISTLPPPPRLLRHHPRPPFFLPLPPHFHCDDLIRSRSICPSSLSCPRRCHESRRAIFVSSSSFVEQVCHCRCHPMLT